MKSVDVPVVKDPRVLHQEELSFFAKQFDRLRPALMEVNERMRTMEDSIEQKNIEKAYRQWLELYELIADVKDSTFQKAIETESVDLENAAYNLEEFLFIISDALAEYGIDTITTAPGSPFHGKYHDAGKVRNFDPATATVAESLRSGFVWGDQVLKKERIRLES
jgi:molecular chaperone GrpE (heat shock protein)